MFVRCVGSEELIVNSDTKVSAFTPLYKFNFSIFRTSDCWAPVWLENKGLGLMTEAWGLINNTDLGVVAFFWHGSLYDRKGKP